MFVDHLDDHFDDHYDGHCDDYDGGEYDYDSCYVDYNLFLVLRSIPISRKQNGFNLRRLNYIKFRIFIFILIDLIYFIYLKFN